MVGLISVSLLLVAVVVTPVVVGKLTSPPTSVVPNGVEIVTLLPNPRGQDRGKEEVTVKNGTDREVDLSGWQLQNEDGERFSLMGVLPRGGKLVILLPWPSMSLSNNGDTVFLIDPFGIARSKADYTGAQGRSGLPIEFKR